MINFLTSSYPIVYLVFFVFVSFGVVKSMFVFHVAGVWMIASYEFLVFRISTDGLSFHFRYDWDSHGLRWSLGDLLGRLLGEVCFVLGVLIFFSFYFPSLFAHILHGLVATKLDGILDE